MLQVSLDTRPAVRSVATTTLQGVIYQSQTVNTMDLDVLTALFIDDLRVPVKLVNVGLGN
jgi:hypothetical protein